MGSMTSDDEASDQQSERCESYSLSADVSESESCSGSSFSYRRFDAEEGFCFSLRRKKIQGASVILQLPLMINRVPGWLLMLKHMLRKLLQRWNLGYNQMTAWFLIQEIILQQIFLPW
ncbi:uncharacterized protein LOC116146998 [Pistacia vera]|uniref:uncharacterized protein LOC116146998 n=1 Tax=Pistacia vera TaxID=55513 RepID=UPI001263BF24|nr:uncharacterized protein LOC116146998 [Pistacia vera]